MTDYSYNNEYISDEGLSAFSFVLNPSFPVSIDVTVYYSMLNFVSDYGSIWRTLAAVLISIPAAFLATP